MNSSVTPRILLLGGTAQATQMAERLATLGHDAIFSYAGRTRKPVAQPLPTRVGGFGGVEGMRRFLQEAKITHVIDATHPFAAQMSRNAIEACDLENIALCAFERAPWTPIEGDNWIKVTSIAEAVDALNIEPARVFLAIGKQNIAAFAPADQHCFLLRLVDPPEAVLPLSNTSVILGRGPFELDEELALLKHHNISHIVAKNSGGIGAQAKIDAARILGLPIIMIERPFVPDRQIFASADDVMTWLDHEASRSA